MSLPRFLSLAWVAASILVQPCFGIVDKNSTTNTSDPGNGAPWGNVGFVNGASGIYLGHGWALTAAHVGPGTITFDIGSFDWSGEAVRLVDPVENTPADLTLFRLTAIPALAPVNLSAFTPIVGSNVVFIAQGRIRGSIEKLYDNGRRGFDWSEGQAKSWGTNQIGGLQTINTGFGPTRTFTTDFSKFSETRTFETANEAQGTLGDSGGGAFYNNLGTWELAGMIDAVGGFTGQPANTAQYGNLTYSADISMYRSQILAVVPEPGSALLAAAGLLWMVSRRRERQTTTGRRG